MRKVTVHRFTTYDVTTDTQKLSERWATKDGVQRARGTIVAGTAIQIDESQLETDGMTRKGFRP